jgi:O-acetyl-ADP-ribose deacetylase (regulator of RNase III)
MRIEAVRGDITAERVDAIVNAANSSLLGGGGVDGAIHAAAGPDLLAECREVRRTTWPNGLPTGAAAATGGGHLTARHVIHTVGPKHWEHDDGGADLLAACHRNSLATADELGLVTVSFPAISCGAFGWTPGQAAPVAIAAVREYAASHPGSTIKVVRFVLFNDQALRAYASAMGSVAQ